MLNEIANDITPTGGDQFDLFNMLNKVSPSHMPLSLAFPSYM